MSYGIRYNTRHKGHILVSCTNGHPIRDINTTFRHGSFANAANESDLANNKFRCDQCEEFGDQRAVGK
jgi:hypothetical protein